MNFTEEKANFDKNNIMETSRKENESKNAADEVQEIITSDSKHEGSQHLIDKYNINDQAHSDSSVSDFIKTTSNFRHADENK